jgi:outer membrane protein
MKLQIPIFLFCLFVIAKHTFAQQPLTLRQCLDHALEHNLDLQLAQHRQQEKALDLLESKAAFLPTLNAGAGFGINYGRSIDGVTNAVTFDQNRSNNYWVSSSVDLFQGLVRLHAIEHSRLSAIVSAKDTEQVKNRLVMDVLTAFYSVAYSAGLIDVAKSQVTLSEIQVARMEKLVETGREAGLNIQELKSTLASDKLNQTVAQNNHNKTLLTLKHLLRFDAGVALMIDTSGIGSVAPLFVQSLDSMYIQALEVLPDVYRQEILYRMTAKELKMARGRISPRLYLSAGFYTNYFDGAPTDFSTQLTDNQNQAITLGLSIPIFNGLSTHNNIKRKKVALLERELELQKQKDALYAEISRSQEELLSAEQEFAASVELRAYSLLALENVTKKMEKGLATPTEYETARQRYVLNEANLLKSKLMFILRRQMLEFYRTGSWEHVL